MYFTKGCNIIDQASDQPIRRFARQRSKIVATLVTAGALLTVIELAVARLTPVLNVPQGIWQDVTHSVLLGVLALPAFYLLVVRPRIKLQMKGHNRTEQRTADLVDANEHLRNHIAAKEEAQESLRKSQARLDTAHRIARMGCWEWNVASNEVYRSDEIYRIFGLTPNEFGATYEAFVASIHPDDREFVSNEIDSALRDGKDYDVDYRVVLPDGEVRHLHEQGEVERNESGHPVRMVGTVIDITQRKEAEYELIANNVNMAQALQREKNLSTELEATAKRFEIAKLQAQAASRSKSEFLANMSHEIRTPMTAILGFAENLNEPDQSEADRINCVRTIRRNGEYLLNIINDILDLSKVEAGKMMIERVPCDPCEIIAEVASLARVRAETTGLPFTVEYIGEIPQTIQSDPVRLRQILINLIGNAMKFTDSGSVRLVTRFVDDPTTPHLQFDVIDAGRGMTPDQVARLFQPFTQADASITRKYGGTGLGLTISKRFADMLGGDITVVRSAIGLGTTFRATIATGSLEGVPMHRDPLSATTIIGENDEGTPDLSKPLAGFHILLVEDGLDNQRLIAHILKRAGADVTIKDNGQLALDAIRTAQSEGSGFDTVLMDMQMPILDGYAATAQLREGGFTAPIIALTAHAMASDRQKCMDAGCTDYASKPINRKKLIEMIRHHLDRAAAA